MNVCRSAGSAGLCLRRRKCNRIIWENALSPQVHILLTHPPIHTCISLFLYRVRRILRTGGLSCILPKSPADRRTLYILLDYPLTILIFPSSYIESGGSCGPRTLLHSPMSPADLRTLCILPNHPLTYF